MNGTEPRRHQRVLRRATLAGYTGLIVFAGTFGLWAATAPISGAVIAQGRFVAESELKKIQHETGGVVAELKVAEGDHVRAGDLLIRLDPTLARANLAITSRQLDELRARAARLAAERDLAATVAFPPDLAARENEAAVAAIMASEAKLFEARATSRKGVAAQLGERIAQLRAEIEGLSEQRRARLREKALVATELASVRELYARKLTSLPRLSELERQDAALDGTLGQLSAQIAEAQGRIAETGLKVIEQTDNLRADAMKELREVEARIGELDERRVAAEDQLARIDIRAPVSGIVHQLAVHTVGGVISPAEPAMLIVPSDDALSLDVRVAPTDIDQVVAGQPATVKIMAFNQRTTPQVKGRVTRIAADVSRDPLSGAYFYGVRVRMEPQALSAIAPLQVQPGMQAEAYFETGARTAIEYLAQPLMEQVGRAFRER